ncbi:hypothetical protein BDF14DRAFT_1819937 [Spinellus fusiger]|nr:hypothetical protein BDF14DRAFT_1819937 [Spinellus fusiger]
MSSMSDPQSIRTRHFLFPLSDSTVGYRLVALGMNAIYLLSVIEDMVTTGSDLLQATTHSPSSDPSLATSAIFLAMTSVLLLCLVVDLLAMTTTKSWAVSPVWHPGAFFFCINCTHKALCVLGLLLNQRMLLRECEEKYTFSGLPMQGLSLEICQLKLQLNSLTASLLFLKDAVVCGVYVVAAHVYVDRRRMRIKAQQTLDPEIPMPLMGCQVPRTTTSPTFSEAPTLLEPHRH